MKQRGKDMAASYKKLIKMLIDRKMKSKDRATLTKVSPATITLGYHSKGYLSATDIKPGFMQRKALEKLNRYRDMGISRALVITAAGSGKP